MSDETTKSECRRFFAIDWLRVTGSPTSQSGADPDDVYFWVDLNNEPTDREAWARMFEDVARLIRATKTEGGA